MPNLNSKLSKPILGAAGPPRLANRIVLAQLLHISKTPVSLHSTAQPKAPGNTSNFRGRRLWCFGIVFNTKLLLQSPALLPSSPSRSYLGFCALA